MCKRWRGWRMSHRLTSAGSSAPYPASRPSGICSAAGWSERWSGGVIFQTDDCRGTYEKLTAAGVEFTQEPIERFYGTDCALRDPFGNPIRFTQPPDGPVVIPSADELRTQT